MHVVQLACGSKLCAVRDYWKGVGSAQSEQYMIQEKMIENNQRNSRWYKQYLGYIIYIILLFLLTLVIVIDWLSPSMVIWLLSTMFATESHS